MKAEFGPEFTTNLEVPPEQIKVLKFLPQGKMIEKEADSELIEKVRAMSNIDPEQPTVEVYTEESISRRYKLLEREFLDSKKIWAEWLKELKTKKGPLEMSRANEIQNQCKSMNFEWVLPE